jgi:hypothetical protein
MRPREMSAHHAICVIDAQGASAISRPTPECAQSREMRDDHSPP